MLEVYLSVIHALLTLTDMRRYHAQLLTVTSNIDMISVVFIRDKLLKLPASVSIHTTDVSLCALAHFQEVRPGCQQCTATTTTTTTVAPNHHNDNGQGSCP